MVIDFYNTSKFDIKSVLKHIVSRKKYGALSLYKRLNAVLPPVLPIPLMLTTFDKNL